ncbi:MAG: ABC transporter permease [Oligoflexia bacterium]|nr:ABC transporter permease [Oligoflexia bacterium]
MFSDIALILGTTLMYSTPLIFTALGGVISEKSGVVNIGLEGMMTIGAFIGATVGYFTGNPWIALLAAGSAAMVLALFHAIASIHFAADQVISGMAINFLGPGISIFLCRIFFDGTTMSLSIPLDQKIPRPLNGFFAQNSFFDLIFNQYATVYLAFVLMAIIWFVLYKTRLGLRMQAVGEHPKAADSLGISVYKIRYIAVLCSGFLAGIGGASMALSVVSNFRPTLISGQGFIALAAIIFGKWKPQGATLACLLFGGAQAFVIFLGNPQVGVNISSQLLAMIPYILTILILMGFVGRTNAPAAVGVPFEKH